MLIAAVGIVLSIIGIFAVRTKENATIRELLKALAIGTNLSSVLIALSTFGILYLLELDNWFWISCSVIIGLLVGIVIGQSTEYYTSQSYKPTQRVSEAGLTGPATVIISGLGLGMLSTAIPVLAVVAGIICSFLFASGFDFNNVGMGLYGIGHRRRRDALDIRDHFGYGRLRADCRQCRRQCGNVRLGQGSTQTYGCARLLRQHDRRNRQRICDRLGSLDGPGIAGLLCGRD